MSLLQETLVRVLIQNPPNQQTTTSSGEEKENKHDDQAATTNPFTTSLSQLRNIQFGLAPEDGESKNKDKNGMIDESDSSANMETKIALMICAIVPSSSTTSTTGATATTTTTSTPASSYRDTQAQNLVLYHLRRYAAALEATLCFVRLEEEKSPEETEEDQQQAMTVNEMTYRWREWVLGNQQEEEEGPAAMYSPGKHQEDLIEGVLLRNAQCPGYWDASKDSLWKALPPSSSLEVIGSQQDQKTSNASGDEAWLAKLRDSVVSDTPGMQTPPPKEKPEKKKKKKGGDADVSNFFESLLNN